MSTQPNVLLVMVDQWPGKLLGSAGHPDILTPTLDHLVRMGTQFTSAYSACPICIPARRTVMTGTTPRTHGDRVFLPAATMPRLPTLAQCFRDGGYQAYAVGKLHVYPQRDRIGFDDVVLAEEGRPQLGAVDDYDLFLADQGMPGEQFMHGMNNNDYLFREWHLPERLHVTNWVTREACRMIKRRDPTRPAFWHVSYTHPHPPLVPLRTYLDLYDAASLALPVRGGWEDRALPPALQSIRDHWPIPDQPARLQAIRRAFYALCTHIDHQLRVLLGTLREEQMLDDTVLLFCSDHGDMLGDFGLWAKRLFYEGSARVPMLLVGPPGERRIGVNHRDPRLVELQDVMPTLLSLASLPVPETVEGLSMVGDARRETLYGECKEGAMATRMAHDGRHKLIWYPVGQVVQMFDLQEDPDERHDVAADPERAEARRRLERVIAGNAWGDDSRWIEDGRLVGVPAPARVHRADRQLGGQRGLHYPQPPLDDPSRTVGSPG